MRTTIEVIGARENNLKNINVEIPREKLVVMTGISGSGKSSLAFQTIYGEGQRRFMESLSSFAKRFIQQLQKPDVDFVYGLSPVISIEQKTVGHNPRSTVGTMTDINNYLQLLFATIGEPHCPYTSEPVPTKSPTQMLERLLQLPAGTEVEIRAPIFKIYGEDFPYLFGEIRGKGCRRLYMNGELCDISEDFEVDEEKHYEMEVLVDKLIVKQSTDKHILAAIDSAKMIGEGFVHFHVINPIEGRHNLPAFYDGFASESRLLTFAEPDPAYFGFNVPFSACDTCSGLGTYLQVHPDLLVPDKDRSILKGAFVKEAYNYNPDTWHGKIMHSLAVHYGFSLETPYKDLSPDIIELLLHGSKGAKFPLVQPPNSKTNDHHIGRLVTFDGIADRVERHYRRYRKEQTVSTGMEDYLRKVMVEHTCPDCKGTRFKKQRMLVTVGGKNIFEIGDMSFENVKRFLEQLDVPEKKALAARQVTKEVTGRLDLLLGVGLDYLTLNRRSGTLSGGEGQRIRLSSQIGSGLMGMLYVLDEPSIGLHPKDNVKMIQTLRRLRDIGNTVIVVEHDEETMRAADYIVEMGPGAGVHGGQVVAEGTALEILNNPNSLTGLYLTGRKKIEIPAQRRQPNGKCLRIRGARENNLKNLTVEIPLGMFVCITGASGSGKSTLINDILYKKLYSVFHDSRVLSGEHDGVDGVEHITDVISIDQSAIGRTPRSNPATYVGVYDNIRQLFANAFESQERGYTASRFSFNVKGGRCEECSGEGMITQQLHFMPDVELPCPTCKGKRYNSETLEILYEGKTISDVLDMPIEQAVDFFRDQRVITHKLGVLNELGLGYLTVGQSATTLSGGEAQRVKLGFELGKIKRGAHNFYILDEPTTGLHLADIQRLLDSLNRLVDAGSSVLVIEHHLDVIKTADWVIDLGPEGGNRGGQIIAQGTPEDIAATPNSYTGQYLRPHFLNL